MRGLIALMLASVGCADFAGIGDPKPLAPDAPPVPCTFDTIDLCLYASPQNDLVLNDDLVLSTDRDCDLVYNNPIGRSACVLYARSITVNAKITPRGARPLILAATDRIEVSGFIDLSASITATTIAVPAAGNDRDCISSTVVAAGPGGSFNGKGGDGGTSSGGVVATAAPAIPLPDYLRGGCPGVGGSDKDSNMGSQGQRSAAASGGAIALVAGNAITIATAGKVIANGLGAGGGADGADGGGGGGSGGMIKLVATTVTIAGVVTANGGGGGEGADGATTGSPGADGTLTTMPASGGTGHPAGGDGGAGGAGSTVNGVSGMGGSVATDVDADGGGGGGAGFVVISGELAGAGTISPNPTRLQ